MLHTVSIDPEAQQQHSALRQQLKKDFVKKTEPRKDPYEDKQKDRKKYSKKITKDLKKLAGDPKQIKRMQELTKEQLALLKDEQLRQLYDEREVLRMQNEEIKRLEWLNKRVNHSYGLKNRHEGKSQEHRPRSANKRSFVHQGQYQRWTNTFKRMTKQWDEEYDILDNEKKLIKNAKKLPKHPARCCGNSPGKSHTNNCYFVDPMPKEKEDIKMAITFDTFTGKRILTPSRKEVDNVKARILKKAARFDTENKKRGKGSSKKRASRKKKLRMADSLSNKEAIYNIDSKKKRVQAISDKYTPQE